MRQGGVAIGCDPRQPVGPHRRPKGGDKGYDAGKKVTGRKRHILTDTDGRLLAVRVHGADVQDRDGGKLPLKASRQRFPFVARVFADGGYAGRLVTWAGDKTHVSLEIIRRGARTKGFEVLPRRWVVERTFAWIFKTAASSATTSSSPPSPKPSSPSPHLLPCYGGGHDQTAFSNTL